MQTFAQRNNFKSLTQFGLQSLHNDRKFSARILEWYRQHRRDLPWRKTRDPYTIWLSEIILQQTRVAQGLPYFEKFKQHYPGVGDLADAPEEEVLKLWQGLGYYSRARNLHGTAKEVARERGGIFPDSYQGLLELRGVGPYTAAAIASICYGEPRPVLDGNVFRVLGRYFDVELPLDSGEGRRVFQQLAEAVMDRERIGEYNQAIMEFGAVQCVPKSPDCKTCPMSGSCGALAAGTVAERPVKQGKSPVKKRTFHYVVPLDPAFRTCLLKREGRGIWQGLYEFPLLEQEQTPTPGEVAALLGRHLGIRPEGLLRTVRMNGEPRVHKLSHQHLHTTFWIAHTKPLGEGSIPLGEADRLPVPVLISDFMDTVKNAYF